METATETTQTPQKRGPGRPKGSKSKGKSAAALKRELAELRKQLEGQRPPPHQGSPAEAPSGPVDDDPFSEPTRDQIAAQEAAAAGQEPPPPVAAPDRVPLGPERATMLFGILCQIYNGTSPALAHRMMAGTLATLPQDQHGAVLAAAAEIAALTDTDQAVLGPVLIPRLAQLMVPPSIDLLLALGFVFGFKLVSLMTLRSNPEQAAALLEASKQSTAAAAAILEATKQAPAAAESSGA